VWEINHTCPLGFSVKWVVPSGEGCRMCEGAELTKCLAMRSSHIAEEIRCDVDKWC
jgi:hypothetical protein